jgi:succinate dehydrogenase/fumarate reductase cytochrome b subunit
MRRIQILKIIIPILALLLTFQVVSGLNPDVIPPAIHRITGLTLAGLVVFHVILNWPWIKANYLKR